MVQRRRSGEGGLEGPPFLPRCRRRRNPFRCPKSPPPCAVRRVSAPNGGCAPAASAVPPLFLEKNRLTLEGEDVYKLVE
jgi:hypothetical protein